MTKNFRTLQQDLVESSLSRIYTKIQAHDAGAITAYRGDLSRAENQANNRELVAALKSRGYSVTKVQGAYIENYGSPDEREVSEPSFLVVDQNDTGNLEKDLFRLGRLYDQDSVLFIPQGGQGAYLIGTSKRDNSFPPYKQKEVVGNFRGGFAKGPFFSRKGGRQFTFETVEEPKTINGKRGWHILNERVEEKLSKLQDTWED